MTGPEPESPPAGPEPPAPNLRVWRAGPPTRSGHQRSRHRDVGGNRSPSGRARCRRWSSHQHLPCPRCGRRQPRSGSRSLGRPGRPSGRRLLHGRRGARLRAGPGRAGPEGDRGRAVRARRRPEDRAARAHIHVAGPRTPAEEAKTVSHIISAYPAAALDAHVRLELGIDPDRRGSARQAAVASFVSFASGAVLPLLPWFFSSGTAAIVASIIIGAVAALLLGGAIGAFTGRGIVRTARRQLTAAVVAAAVTYGVGRLLGTQPADDGFGLRP